MLPLSGGATKFIHVAKALRSPAVKSPLNSVYLSISQTYLALELLLLWDLISENNTYFL